ncbi:MAG: hypothetical protein WCL08_13515, partial [Verrucomicrobiota bacterium]
RFRGGLGNVAILAGASIGPCNYFSAGDVSADTTHWRANDLSKDLSSPKLGSEPLLRFPCYPAETSSFGYVN